MRVLIFLVLASLLQGCLSTGPKVVDGGPSRPLDVSHIPDAVPRWEPRTRAGNSNPYTVLGETYYLVENTTDFRQQGYASWYGTKFHGQLTANGEIYNMYGMTAAHKTLPIPSYVRVTNQDNGKSVVVRINDRGPFHGGRIIDLTYTAAKKLGFVAQGTAPVIVEYIETSPPQFAQTPRPTGPELLPTTPTAPAAPKPVNSAGYAIPENTFLQVGAFSSATAARTLQKRLRQLTNYPVVIKTAAADELLRVQVGPFKNNLHLMSLQQKLLEKDISKPYVVYQ